MGTLREIDRWAGGFGWIAHPDESMERASQAIRGDSGYWLVDPVDADGLDELLADVDVAGIVLTLDRHKRDVATLGKRYDVPVSLPEPLYGEAAAIEHAVTDASGFRADTGWEIVTVIDRRWWSEVALYSDSDDVVYVSEALGTASYFCAPNEDLGVHPMLRLIPPRGVLSGVKADRVLVGHGEGIPEGGVAAITAALRDARRNAPRTYWNAVRRLV